MAFIPEGEVGSVNYWTKKATEDMDFTVMQIADNTSLVLNVIYNLVKYVDLETALSFSIGVNKINGSSN